ncbi:MAG TPA: ATP-binding protein [Gammaproteobacteria bacterium]|nr:ATP-binding protein [Gammaproteobacteria bacterium]
MRVLPRSLFGRLLLVLAVGLTAALIGSATINLHEQHHLMEHAGVERIAEHIAYSTHLFEQLTPADRRAVARHMSHWSWRYRIGNSPPSLAADRHLPGRLAALAPALASRLGAAYPIRVAGPDPAGRARDGRSRDAGEGFVAAVGLHDGDWLTISTRFRPPPPDWPVSLFVKLAILLLVALLLSFLAVTWVTRPLAMLAEAARALGRDIRRPPLVETGPSEVRRAAAAFNLMQQRLLGFLDGRMRTFLAVSHDLKTPVTRLRLRAEMLEDPGLREAFNEDLDEMDAMLSATLAYLRGESEQEPAQPLDVNALLASMASDAEALGQPVTVAGRAAAPYRARPRALRRCLDNLVQNALRYGGSAEIAIEDENAALVIRVSDRGPGLPEAELERVFEPFYRGEASRNRATGGTGLGLASAREAATAHGGTLTLANREGGGLVATLTLPR